MRSELSLRKTFEAACRRRRFQPVPEVDDTGLTLGRGTVIAGWSGNPGDGTEGCDRVAALLAATCGRPVPRSALTHVERAHAFWCVGELALAQIEIAFARLPRLATDDEAYRLFLADALLTDGMTPAELMSALGFDVDLTKYDPDQPRVPAGNGRASGQFGSRSGSVTMRSSAQPPRHGPRRPSSRMPHRRSCAR